MRDIKLLLQAWGSWATTGYSGIGYSSVAAGFRGLVPLSPSRRVVCGDHDGMILDSCITRLKSYHPAEHQLLVAHYHYRISLRSLARRWHCADGTLRKQLQTAEGFVEGMLCAMDSKLELDKCVVSSG